MLAAALLTAVAAALLVPPRGSRRLGAVAAPTANRSRDVERTQSRWWASPVVAAALGGAAVLQVVGQPLGLVLAVVSGAAAYRWVSKAESAGERRRRELLSRDLPLAVDLLVACLAVGRPPGAALSVVAGALRGPLAQELRVVASQLEMGADAGSVWQGLSKDPVLAPVGRAFARAARSGSSVTSALSGCADDLRRRRRADAFGRARSAGVKAAGPLGACFLPAFVLIGIVPTVVSLFEQIVP